MDFFQPTAKKRYLFASLSAKSEKRWNPDFSFLSVSSASSKSA
jgi:hypothetical protein